MSLLKMEVKLCSFKDFLLQVHQYFKNTNMCTNVVDYYKLGFTYIQNLLLKGSLQEKSKFISNLFICIHSKYTNYILYTQNYKYNSNNDLENFINKTIKPMICDIIQLHIVLDMIAPMTIIPHAEFEASLVDDLNHYNILTFEQFNMIIELCRSFYYNHNAGLIVFK